MSEAVPRDAADPLPRSPSLADLVADADLASRRVDVAAGDSVYEPTSPARSVYVIHGGQVRLLRVTPGATQRAVRLLEILGPGDWFGAPALAGGQTYDTRAVAVTAVAATELPVDRLMAALPNHPAVAAALIQSLGQKLQASYAEAANLVFDDTNQRLIKTLLQFSRSAAATPQAAQAGQPTGVELRITHQQLAQAIGAARETVSLALTQLRQKNLLRTGRNRLSFNPDALEGFYRKGGGKADDVPVAGPADVLPE